MFLLVLRRYRAQILTLALLTVVTVVFLLVNGTAVDDQVAQCAAAGVAACDLQPFYVEMSPLLTYFPIATLVVGVFWGAPLVSRDIELGTARFVWAQTVSRRRWFVWYAGLLSAIVVVLSAVVGLAVAWWLDRFAGHDLPGVGDDRSLLPMRGLALTGWWWAAFGIGVLVGSLVRRTLAAMAVTGALVLTLFFLSQTVVAKLLFDPLGADLAATTAIRLHFGVLSGLAVATIGGAWWVVRRVPA